MVLARYTYNLKESSKRLEILSMMHEGCFMSPIYYMRLNYIHFVIGMSEHCSRKFFALYKCVKVLEMSEDKVLDVRITLAKNLFELRMIIDDNDDTSLQLFKSVVAKMLGQKNQIISSLVKQSEERTFAFNASAQKLKLNEENLKKQQLEEKTMSEELKVSVG